MLSSWPEYYEEYAFAEECKTMEDAMDIVRNVRNIRAEMKVPVGQKISMDIITDDSNVSSLRVIAPYLLRLAGAENADVSSKREGGNKSDVHLVCKAAEVFIPLTSLVDISKEIVRIEKEIERLNGEVKRAEGKLNNEKFTSKAPQTVVDEEKRKFKEANDMLEKLNKRLTELQKI